MTKQSHQWGQEKRDVRQGDQCVGQGSKEKRSQEDVYLESFILRIWLATVEASKVKLCGSGPGKSDVAVQVHSCLPTEPLLPGETRLL